VKKLHLLLELAKYIVFFFFIYVAINIGIKYSISTQWKENPNAIEALIKQCNKNTKVKFNLLEPNLVEKGKAFIMSGKTFNEPLTSQQEFYKKCISEAIYYYSPNEYFNR